MFSENQIIEAKINPEKFWSTIEPQILVEKAYPDLVRSFRESKIKLPKKNKTKKKLMESENKGDASPTVPAVKKAKRTNLDKRNEDNDLEMLENSFKELNVRKKTATLDSFLKKALLRNQTHNLEKKQVNDVTKLQFDENILQTSTPSKNVNMNWSSFCDEDDNSNLSDIIDNIVLRKPVFTTNNFQEMNLLQTMKTSINNRNSSCFFINCPNEDDAFEKTFNEITEIGSEESTEEYELDEINNILDSKDEDVPHTSNVKINNSIEKECFGDNEKKAKQEVLYDSFVGIDIDIPLMERIKKEK